MKRLRWVFVLLALALLVPLALLVRKALASASLEHDMLHQALAERVVDEMERELTAWLQQEEDRPFAHYRYFTATDESSVQEVQLVPSPLATGSSEPFVRGYFQIDPDGSFSSPRLPGNRELARRTAGWELDPEVEAEARRLERTVRGIWSAASPAEVERAEAQKQTESPAMGAKVERLGKEKKGSEERPAEKSLLSTLNRAARSRGQRPTKVAPSQAASVYNFSRDKDNELQMNQLQQRQLEDDLADLEAAFEQAPEAVAEDIRRELDTGPLAPIDVRLEPMIGRPVDAETLALYRTVLIGDKAYRQGLVLEIPALVEWLGERVLEGERLATRARVLPSRDLGEVAAMAYVFRHRFVEPFAAAEGILVLEPLPPQGGTVYLYALSALLAVAATAGLYALYRMVAVVVGYSERRSNFVSAVTHELKTPLTALRMYAEMLRDGLVLSDAKRQRYYELMTAESERLSRLVNNVLELARLEHDPRPMKVSAGDIGGVLQEAVSSIAPHASREGFELRLEVEPDLPAVRYHRDALLQVLFNLIDNSVKYAGAGEAREVVLRCRGQGDGVVLTVADQGPGVREAELKRIFEPFYRVGNELTRTAKGTGIGLALVRGLIEGMGGRVVGRNGEEGGFAVDVFLAAAPSGGS